MHRGSLLLLALAAVLGVIPVAWLKSDRRSRLPWLVVGPALLLAAVELFAGAGPVHRAPGLPSAAWGALEGLATGLLLAAAGVLFVRPSCLRGERHLEAPGPPARARAGPVGAIAAVLIVASVAQFSLGIAQRAERSLLLGHAILGIAVILPLTVRLGIAAVLVSPARTAVRHLGLVAAVVVGLQTILGVGLLLPRAAPWVAPWTKVLHHLLGAGLVALFAAVFAVTRPRGGAESPRRG